VDAEATHLATRNFFPRATGAGTTQHRASSQDPGGRESSRPKFPNPSAPRPRPPCACPHPTPPTTVSAVFASPPTPRPTSAMRIRRYAARLLSATTAAPSSPPRPPAASWLHTDDDDDCCAFCELSRPAPQVTRTLSPSPSFYHCIIRPRRAVAVKGALLLLRGGGCNTGGVPFNRRRARTPSSTRGTLPAGCRNPMSEPMSASAYTSDRLLPKVRTVFPFKMSSAFAGDNC
jgi:hypothetical protein